MAEGNSLYRTLGLSPVASPADIKQAYHKRAKAAHPDAGGSVTVMAAVNEAYQILSDPVARRAYDEAETPPVEAPSASHGHAIHRQSEADQRAEAAAIHRGRVVWARRSAWELLRFSVPLAVGAIIVTRFAPGYITNPNMLRYINIVGFIPVYALIVGIIFLNDPSLRLVFADLARRYPTTKSERVSALALIVAYFPLAFIWALWH